MWWMDWTLKVLVAVCIVILLGTMAVTAYLWFAG